MLSLSISFSLLKIVVGTLWYGTSWTQRASISELFLIHYFLCNILFPFFNMGIGYFLHTNEYVRGRGDVPGLICRNEYKKKNFLTCLVADLIVCSAEGQMFLATYAGMSTKKNLSDTLGGGSQAVSPEKKDYRSLHTEWKRDFRPHTATVFSSSLLPRHRW